MMRIGIKSVAVMAGLAGIIAMPRAHAAGIDWSGVPGKEIVLFYPGQSPWEWALTADSMTGATKFRQEGKSCFDCHDGEEKGMGDHIVSGKPRVFKDATKPPIEPTPIAGKPGWITATAKFANDGTNLYVHLDIKDGTQPDAKQDPVATKVAIMFTRSASVDIAHGGCFAACHDDMTGMPSAGGATRTHYLSATHAKLSRQGGGDTLKPDADLAKLKSDGYFLEDWQAKFNPGQPAQTSSYIVFAKRDQAAVPLTADVSSAGGVTSVTFSSKLAPGGDLLGFAPGTVYRVAFAVHEGHTAGRFHYISLERTLAITSGSADFVAVKK